MKSDSIHNILVDSSFILTMLRKHRDFDDEIRKSSRGPVRIITTDGVIMELQRLARSGNFETAGLARIALASLERSRIDVQDTSPSTPNVDTAILLTALAEKNSIKVATVDRRLRNTLFKLGVPVICPRAHAGVVILPGARAPLK